MRPATRFVFRGKTVEISGFPPHQTLLDWLRLEARATGTKEGCAEGDCGACTVVLARARNGEIEHRAVNSCILLLGQADGAEVLTIEDLSSGGELHPVQEAMVRHHGSQCGFCTPGIVMSLFAGYQHGQLTDRAAVADILAGNLCRCTGYRPIVDAALDAGAGAQADAFAARQDQRLAALTALATGDDLFVGTQDSFFAAPASEDAFARLYAENPDALLVGGATDVGLWITKALQTPAKIIWLGRIAGFDAVHSGDHDVAIMAGAPLADAAAPLASIDPDLGEVMRRFGSAQVRASGTVGGNIANGSPIGDLAPCLIALDARLELRRGNAMRTIPLENFFLDYRKQDRAPGEYVRRILVPRLEPGQDFRAFKVSKRFDEDISAVMGAFRFTLADGEIRDARITFGGMAATPRRAPQAEAACRGLLLFDSAAVRAAADTVTKDYQPIDDMRASAAYRRIVAANLLFKALTELSGMAEATRIASMESIHAAG